jgi:hypothetical protein
MDDQVFSPTSTWRSFQLLLFLKALFSVVLKSAASSWSLCDSA